MVGSVKGSLRKEGQQTPVSGPPGALFLQPTFPARTRQDSGPRQTPSLVLRVDGQ